MQPTTDQILSIPFEYANDVHTGKILTGLRIKQAVARFYKWIETAESDGFYIDHAKGMRAIRFFETFLNHTKGKMAGKPFVLAPFQQFTIYNVFGWQNAKGFRRINTVYDKRAKKNGKSAEMGGIGLFGMSFDLEMEAEIYVGATKEDQARICWKQAAQFIDSPVANPMIRHLGFYVRQSIIGFTKTASFMRPLGGDSKTQDGINAHISIIDEYHAHKDDGVKENLESSSVQRNQPLVYHITTAGTNVQSACKHYEDSVIEVLEGRKKDDSLWVMIHDLDEDDDWENEDNWYKANPLLGQGLDIDQIRKEFVKCQNQPRKIPNFKTKHLNMWVDAPKIWIPNEIWMKGKHELTTAQVLAKFKEFGCYAGLDLSTTTDLSAYVLLSEPDECGERYIVPFFFCPKDTIDIRSKEDRVPYRYWADEKHIIATPGNVIDYFIIADKIIETYYEYGVLRMEYDQHNAAQLIQQLQALNINLSAFSQAIGNMSHVTKEFERLVYSGKMRHDGNPVLAWMLAGCQIYSDANENIKVHKGQSNVNGRRIDGIPATLNALGGSLSPADDTGKYSKPMNESDIYI